MLRPRSLSARLFLATAAVAVAALIIGSWLVRRAVHVEINEKVRLSHDDAGAPVREVVREVVGDPRDGPSAPASVDRRLLAALAIVIAGSAAATFLITRRIVGPVGRLRSAAATLAGGDLSARVPEGGTEELASLAAAFNRMAATLEEQEQRKRDLSNDIAHELRTPITNLRCHLEALADGVVPLDRAALSTLTEDVRHLERLAGDLGVLAQADAHELRLAPEPVDLAAAVDHLARDVAPRLAASGLSLNQDMAVPLRRALVDRVRLIQIVTNLLENAISHTPAGGSVTIRGREESGMIRLDVVDTGEGIEARHLPHVFDRFYRADPSRSRRTGGAGLGLAIARQLVTSSGGRIAVTSEPGRGTTFSVWLPAHS
jgi:two-component system sensor histidine kinase BaeS